MALNLTDAQEDIVYSTDKRILVVAAPGCGKTTSLAYHLANVIRNELAPASRILCLSYSQLSQSAISKYLSKACDRGEKLPNIRSFVSLCYSIMSRHLGLIHPKLFNQGLLILDDNDPYYLSEIRDLLWKHGIDEQKIDDFRVFVKKVQNSNCDSILDSLFTVGMVNELRELLFNQNCILLGDFSYLAYAVLTKNDVFESELGFYRRLYVDEFQDANFYQSRIIKMIVDRSDCYSFITGNVDECVYGFRGASQEYLESLVSTGAFTVFDNLAVNFRSRQGIVDFSQAIEHKIDLIQGISAQRHRIEARFDNSAKPVFLTFKTKEQECKYVAESIGRLVHENGVKFGDVAVLTYHGSGGFELGQIKSNLIALGYPCTTYGTKEDEGETLIMSSIFVCLSTFYENGLNNFLNRITTLMKTSYNQKGFQKIASNLSGREFNGMEEVIPFLYQHISEMPQKAVLSLTNAYKAYVFFKKEQNIIQNNSAVPLSDILMDLEIFLMGYAQKSIDPVLAKAFERASANLKELEKYGEGKNPNEVLASLHDGVSSFKDDDTGVQLMTFTKSKGLQFHSVFLVGLEPETFPGTTADRTMSELERLRLFYVAATRAKYALCMTAVAEDADLLLSSNSKSVVGGLRDSVKVDGDFGRILVPDSETVSQTNTHIEHQNEVSERLRKDRARSRAIIRLLTSDDSDVEEKKAAHGLLALLEEKTKTKTEQILTNEKQAIDWYMDRICSLVKRLDGNSRSIINDFLAIDVDRSNADAAFFYRVSVKTLCSLTELLVNKTDQFVDDLDSQKILREFNFRDSCHQLLIPILRTLNNSSSDSLTALLNKTDRSDAIFWKKCFDYGIDLNPNKSRGIIDQMKCVSSIMDTYYHFKGSTLPQNPSQDRFLQRNRVFVEEFLKKDANGQKRILLSCVRFMSKFFKATRSKQLFDDASQIIYSDD